MEHSKRVARITSAIFLFLAIQLHANASAKLPVEAFGSLPDVSQIQLSPSGEKILYVSRLDGSDLLFALVYDFKAQKVIPILKSDNEKYKLSWVRWANDDQILASVRFAAVRYGTPTAERRLMLYDLNDLSDPKNVLTRSFYKDLSRIPQFQDDVIDFIPEDPNRIVLSVTADNPVVPKVFEINLRNLKRKTIQRPRTNVTDWITDRQHRVRASVALHEKEYRVDVKGPNKKDKWRELARFEAFSEEQVWPIGFDLDPNILYVRAYHQGRLAIFKVDLTQDQVARELVYADEHYDVDGALLYSRITGEVIGITFSEGQGFTFWEDSYKALQRGLNKNFPGEHATVVNFSQNERKAIVEVTSDRNPGMYYLLDRDRGALDPIISRYSKLPPEAMAEKESYGYKARDGLEIDAFLTRPVLGSREKLPAIIFPHGGPISYDDGGFDYWTQFFASRGYAVLQMNFRGSSGYGFDFMQAGLQGWGKAMQDDVEDGVRALIRDGIVDEGRVCIAGASYGGYAALMGAVKTPELYQCVISFAGVTDVKMMIERSRRYLHSEIAEEQIGSKGKQLKAVSPVNFSHDIQVPVLLVHGEKDRVVDKSHSRKMYKRLKKSQKQVEYIELENGSHYLQNNQNRLATFKAMDSFLAKHLPTTIHQ